jgi:serine acetyltransferase
MRFFLSWVMKKTKPWVWKLAEAYDLRIDRPHTATGPEPLIIEDTPEMACQNIPKNVVFNTGSGKIVVGRNTMFGEDVHVLTGKHMGVAEARATGMPLHHVTKGRDIHIGRNCYIGGRSVLVGPLVIGDGAMICAGAVVTREVPPGAFVAGSPARVFFIPDSANTESAK